MAKYEQCGATIGNRIFELSIENSERSKKVERLFENRLDYAVYTDAICYKEDPYIVQFLKNASDVILAEFASHLRVIFREPKEGEKIWITDCINPFQIPEIAKENESAELEYYSLNESTVQVIQDEVFLIGVIKDKNDVYVYIYKK